MKFTLEDVGVMQEAEFELADLTIICGKNNTGKTYVANALYGFLNRWHYLHDWSIMHYEGHSHKHWMHINSPFGIASGKTGFISMHSDSLKQLEKDGKCEIDIKDSLKIMQIYISDICKEYSKKLPIFFASSEKYFEHSLFSALIDKEKFGMIKETKVKIKDNFFNAISISKKAGDTKFKISLLSGLAKEKLSEKYIQDAIIREINTMIAEEILIFVFPKPFISSAERTGVATFRKELNFARNKLLSEMSSIKNDEDLGKLYRKNYSDYALPINENVNFIRALETIAKHDSFIAKKHPKILTEFSKIIGGKYVVGENDMIYYQPNGENMKLTMGESSSGVRSLLDVGCYLHYQAEKGDLLIIDEPELNLHPENQRKIARLFARLVNIGVKVFITTHSDYITSELSNLILLNSKDERIIKIAEENNYKKEELISHEQVKLYTAEPIKANSKKYTLNRAKIDAESGIDAEIFNKTIDEMNEIKEEIFFG